MTPEETEKLVQRALTGDYEVHGDPQSADCLIGFSFGYRIKDGAIVPGISNDDIADFIHQHFMSLSKILQFEVADALGPDNSVSRVNAHRVANTYLGTREVAEQALSIMQQKGWRVALMVAHPYHMPRTDAFCTKLGIETIVPDGLKTIRFDPESEQDWTRNAELWSPREEASIRRYAEKGYI